MGLFAAVLAPVKACVCAGASPAARAGSPGCMGRPHSQVLRDCQRSANEDHQRVSDDGVGCVGREPAQGQNCKHTGKRGVAHAHQHQNVPPHSATSPADPSTTQAVVNAPTLARSRPRPFEDAVVRWTPPAAAGESLIFISPRLGGSRTARPPSPSRLSVRLDAGCGAGGEPTGEPRRSPWRPRRPSWPPGPRRTRQPGRGGGGRRVQLVLDEHPSSRGLRAPMSARSGPTCISVPSRSSSMPIAVAS